jgi:hypothetical protein
VFARLVSLPGLLAHLAFELELLLTSQAGPQRSRPARRATTCCPTCCPARRATRRADRPQPPSIL